MEKKMQQLRQYLVVMLIFFGILFVILEFDDALVNWHIWTQIAGHACAFLGVAFAITSLRLVGEIQRSKQPEE